ncbi:MAG: ROK family transcriptional regulator [Bacteroidota bacterium]
MSGLSLQIEEDTHKQALKLIRDYGELSGAQIARLAGIQPSTVVYILRRLNKAGFIEYSRTGESTSRGGKRPVLWRIKGSFGYLLGMEVLVDKIRYVLTDFSGQIVARVETHYENYLENGRVPQALLDNIEEVIDQYELNRERLLGIGIAITGLIDNAEAVVQYSSNLQLKELPLKKMIEEKVNVPVCLVNDANAGAMGIKWYFRRVGSLPPNIVYVTYNQISDYLGIGIIINDVLYSGATGTAGEVFEPLPDLFEAGKWAIQRRNTGGPLRYWLDSGKHISLAYIFDLARKDDPVAGEMVNTIIQFLAYQLLLINGFINPDLIVLGGDIAIGEDLILDPLIEEFKRRNREFLEIDYNIPEIMFSEYGNYSVAMGANALIIRELLR